VTGRPRSRSSAAEEPPSPSPRRPSVAFADGPPSGERCGGQRRGPALRCTLSTLESQTVGEIRPKLVPGRARAFLTCLADGSRRLSTLEKEEAYLTLPPTETRLAACVALQAGFERRQSWVRLTIDL